MNTMIQTIRQALAECRIPLPVPIPVPVPRTRTPRVILGALAALLIGAGLSTQASTASAAAFTKDQVDGQLVDVQVLVDGWPAPMYLRPGAWDKSYFQAFKGKNYSLVVRNTTNRRVGVLIAVDGLNVVNGLQSNFSNHESMYVLDPYESATISGWRTSLNNVRRFVFVDEERSYAARTNQANGDLGWIRVLSFREQTPVVWRYDLPKIKDRSSLDGRGSDENEGRRDLRGEAAPAPPTGSSDLRAQKSAPEALHSAPQSESAPGTGWGQSQWDPVRTTQFVAAASPTDRLVLRYEYASGLRALGIFTRTRRVFERERGELGFAQPPRW